LLTWAIEDVDVHLTLEKQLFLQFDVILFGTWNGVPLFRIEFVGEIDVLHNREKCKSIFMCVAY
jgi:hypothetical protein